MQFAKPFALTCSSDQLNQRLEAEEVVRHRKPRRQVFPLTQLQKDIASVFLRLDCSTLTNVEIREAARISQGCFNSHVVPLINQKLVERIDQGVYVITAKGVRVAERHLIDLGKVDDQTGELIAG